MASGYVGDQCVGVCVSECPEVLITIKQQFGKWMVGSAGPSVGLHEDLLIFEAGLQKVPFLHQHNSYFTGIPFSR